MSLDKLNLSQYDLPTEQSAPAADFTARLKRTQSGHEILVCSCDPAPASVIADATARNLPLFTFREIPLLAGMPPEQIDNILTVKRMFPGASVSHLVNLAGGTT